MTFTKYCFALALPLFTVTVFAETDLYNVNLHLNAEPTAQQFVDNICLTTNYGFTKSCGDGAKRSYSSETKQWKIVSHNLHRPLGFDNSCTAFKYGSQLTASGTLDVFATIESSIVNMIEIVSVTNCSTAWTPTESPAQTNYK